MDYFEEFDFHTPEQLRAKNTLIDIAQTIEKLAQSGELKDIKSRNLSADSGYAKSTIFHHFKKFDDIFTYVFLVRRRKAILIITELINQHPADAPLSVLLANMLKVSFEQLNAPPRKALLFVVGKFLKNTQNPHLINLEADIFIPAWMAAIDLDQTNTFVKFNEVELRLRLRALQAVIRSPFFEDSAMAGTSEHFDVVSSLTMNIFSAPVVVS
jgi:AcrR family transcriptional regulator